MFGKLRKLLRGGASDVDPADEPHYPESLAGAFALVEQGRPKEAVQAWEALLSQTPDDPWMWDALGLLHLEVADPTSAEVALRRAFALLPRSRPIFIHLSIALWAQDKRRDLIDIGEALVQARPRTPALLLDHAKNLACYFEKDAALAYVDRALALAPGAVDIQVQAAHVYLEMGLTRPAVELFRKACRADPATLVKIGLQLSELLAAMGVEDESKEVLQQTLERFSSTPRGLEIRGLYFTRRGMRQDALRMYEALVERYPEQAHGWTLLGCLRAGMGDWRTAAADLQRALQMTPDDPMAQELAYSLHKAATEVLPRLQKLAAVLPDPRRAVSRDMIVIRGGLDATYIDTVKHYRAAHPGIFIVLSVWRDTPTGLLNELTPYVDDVVLNDRPPAPGLNNINYQIACAAPGVARARELGAERVLVTRTDIALLRPNLMADLRAELGKYYGGETRRLIISDLYTLMIPIYHFSDIFVYGDVRDVARFWSLESMSESSLRPEAVLTRGFAARAGWTVKNTTHDCVALAKALFVIKAAPWFGFFWIKNPCYMTSSYDPGLNVVTQELWEAPEIPPLYRRMRMD